MKDTQVRIDMDQFCVGGQSRAGQSDIFVGFETFRGFIDMLRFCGPLSVEYDGGGAFHLYLRPAYVTAVIARFDSFGIKAERIGGQE